MPLTLEISTTLNYRVRDFFKPGQKSTNKRYHVGFDGTEGDVGPLGSSELAKMARRNTSSRRASDVLGLYSTKAPTPDVVARSVRMMPLDHRSGNCAEMACLCARWIIEGSLAPVDCVHIATVLKPVGHQFCVVTPIDLGPNQPRYESVRDFTTVRSTTWWLVMDPWLNVACYAKDYLHLSMAQLNTWGTAGKRIGWPGGPQGCGWYSPDGDYKTAFASSPLILGEYY